MSKKKILLLSDDLRMHSGIATMSRELVLGTVHHYDWIQIAGAIKHPEAGKIVDLNQATRDLTKVSDAYVKLYPTDGYGNEQILFSIILSAKHITASGRGFVFIGFVGTKLMFVIGIGLLQVNWTTL